MGYTDSFNFFSFFVVFKKKFFNFMVMSFILWIVLCLLLKILNFFVKLKYRDEWIRHVHFVNTHNNYQINHFDFMHCIDETLSAGIKIIGFWSKKKNLRGNVEKKMECWKPFWIMQQTCAIFYLQFVLQKRST